MSYLGTESELLPYFLEVGELDWVESSRALSHSHTVSRNRVSHVVVVNQVLERSLLNITRTPPRLVHYLTVNRRLDVVVFQQVRSYAVDSRPQLLDTVVGQPHSALLGERPDDFPLLSRVAWGLNHFQTHLNSAFSVDLIISRVP